MNDDRFVFHQGQMLYSRFKFTRVEKEPHLFRRLTAFLGETVHPEGFAYKDVVHPFVVSAWLPLSGLKVLKLKRDLADVCYSMMERGWFYPAHATEAEQASEDSIIEGLILAERAINSVPGECVSYDDLIRDEEVLLEALRRLYPEERVCRVRFIDDEFREETLRVMKRKETPLYKRLEHKVRELTQKMNVT